MLLIEFSRGGQRVAECGPFDAFLELSFHEDMAYMSEMGAERGCPIRVPWGEQLSGINAKAQASFLTVPKCGREILPLALPETVLRLTPVSLANRP